MQPSMRGLSLALLVGAAHAQQTVVTVRGSGTTNPKKIHWELMETMEAMAGERGRASRQLCHPRSTAVLG